MRAKPLSIRGILLLTLSALTLLIVALVMREVVVEWQKMARIESLQNAMVISDELFDATEKLSAERDVAYTMQHAPDAATVEHLQARLRESRAASDHAFAVAMAALKRYDFPEIATLREKIEAQLAGVQALRQQIDQASALPEGKPKKDFSDRWFGQSTAMVAQVQDLWLGFLKYFTDVDPVVTQHLRYKYHLQTIMDYSGRERAIIGRLIVENTEPTPQEFAQLLRGQGIIEAGWKNSAILADQSGLYDSIASYYTDAKSHYLNLHDMVRDIFYVLPGSQHNVSYPIGVDLWFDLSEQAADSLKALNDVSVEATRHYVETLEMQARQSIIAHIVLLIFALILCAYSFRVISHRVIHPINAMVEALVNATEGKPSAMPTIVNPQDEIGKLARVLQAFQETGERYRALIEASSQVVFTWKPGDDSGMDVLKEWWEATTGQPANEMLPFGWVSVAHPDDREWAQKTWAEASASGDNYDMEYRIQARDGSYRWIYVRGVELKHADGSIRELVGALTDVTSRKQAEANLLSYTQALERSNKELDDFAYIASHDLKEPLRGIHNHSRFLLEDNADKLDKDSVDKLGRLVYLSQRMERLVNDLLYFSRLGRQELAIQPTDLNEVLTDIESTLDMFLSERNARIVVPTPLPVTVCDKPRVTELLRNLITNAVKYNDKQDRVVEIGFKPSYASLHKGVLTDVFYVRDNGKGIAPEFHEDIFRIFKRLQSSKDGVEEGTGVGLTFVKKIVERHGGIICLESEPGNGTTFYFTLKGEAYDIANAT